MNIPERYIILDHIVKVTVPTLESTNTFVSLSPIQRREDYFLNELVSRFDEALNNKQFLPIIRFSDGEYRFLLGEKLPSTRLSTKKYLNEFLRFFKTKTKEIVFGFSGQTAPGISVGKYSRKEAKLGKSIFTKGLQTTIENGILGAHLTFTPNPFQEKYHPAFKQWLKKNTNGLDSNNYTPFYCVYGLLGKFRTSNLIKGKSLLIVHCATGEKRALIENRLKQFGAMSVRWIKISSNRALFDHINLSRVDASQDLCILGAGIGKFGLIEQLKSFNGPVLDAGFFFEAWANPKMAEKRAFCIA